MTPSPSRPYHNLAIIALAVGLLLLAASLCALLTFVILPLVPSDPVQDLLATNTAVVSIGAVALAYGVLLIWISRGLRKDQGNPTFQLPSPVLFLAAFVLVLIIGQTLLTLKIGTAYLFPLWHVLASLLVPLTLLAFAVRRLPPVSGRSVLAQFSWGGLVTIALALVFELVIAGVLVILALLGMILVLGVDRVQLLGEAIRAAARDPQRVIQALASEPLAILLVVCVGLLLFVFIVPLAEELLKATGPAILIARRDRGATVPTRSQVVVWGLAAGAGYAFTENMFNTQGALSGGTGVASSWATAMVLRTGTTLMHMIATGTVAVGWYQLIVNRKRARWLVLLAAAMTAHAVWNSAAVLLSVVWASGTVGDLLAFLLKGGVLLFLALLFVAFLFWLWRLIHWAQPPPVEIITSSGMHLEIKG